MLLAYARVNFRMNDLQNIHYLDRGTQEKFTRRSKHGLAYYDAECNPTVRLNRPWERCFTSFYILFQSLVVIITALLASRNYMLCNFTIEAVIFYPPSDDCYSSPFACPIILSASAMASRTTWSILSKPTEPSIRPWIRF